MAHFLEHLVFKGGEIYDDYRKVNETAERMGGALNAYTSHDLVAFHITVRAESAMEAMDLLTDFAGRPLIDAEELDRERGVVIQEIQRYKDQPAAVAGELIERAGYGDHPLGRTVLGPEEHLRTFSRDGDRRLPRAPLVGPQRRRVHRRQPRSRRGQRRGRRADGPLPRPARAGGRGARAGLRPRDPRRGARHQPVAPADALPPRHRRPATSPRASAFSIYATLLGGSMGSRLFDEIREQRGLAYSVFAADHSRGRPQRAADGRRPGLDQVRRGLHADARDRRRAARRGPARGRGRACPRLRGRAARARLREHQRGRPLRRRPHDRPPRGHRPRLRRSPSSTRSPSTRSSRSLAASIRTTSRSGASGRTRLTTSAERAVATEPTLNEPELARFASRVSERWPLEQALVGGRPRR